VKAINIRRICVAYSHSVFEERENRYYQLQPDLKGKTLELIEQALRELSLEVVRLDVDQPLPELIDFFARGEVDFVFNLAVSVARIYNQSFLPSIFDSMGIPYLGSSSTVHSLCLDRSLIKLSLRGIGVPTPSYFLWSPNLEIPENLDLPVIIKPRFRVQDNLIDMTSLITEESQLREALHAFYQKNMEKLLVEKFVMGRELVVGIWGNDRELEVLPIMEVNLSKEKPIRDPELKNQKGYVIDVACPPDLSEEQKSLIESMALKIYRELNLCDFATFHCIFAEKEGMPFFFEINSLPLLHPRHSAFPEMCSVAGFSYEEMIKRLLKIALKRLELRYE